MIDSPIEVAHINKVSVSEVRVKELHTKYHSDYQNDDFLTTSSPWRLVASPWKVIFSLFLEAITIHRYLL